MLIKDIKKMEAYTPTEYVNDSEPDLDADNLNKTERQLRDTVAKANEIIDTLKSLISNVSVNSEDTVPSSAVAYKMEQDIEQLNSNFSFVANDLNQVPSEVKFFKYNGNAQNSPVVNAGIGLQLYYDQNFKVQIVIDYGKSNSLWIRKTHEGQFLAWTKIL